MLSTLMSSQQKLGSPFLYKTKEIPASAGMTEIME
ncbi:hypothetical protein SPHS6_01470 [Sphingobium sp. S6]|nr:hypothetical protein SPHS6_01470 [Sphingobium sp. S6]CAD7339481.1 hypothetical protein SPHS8_02642 [Sphingobium sp. S8]